MDRGRMRMEEAGGRSITLRCVSTGAEPRRGHVWWLRARPAPPGSGLRFVAPRACLCSLLLLSLRERTLRIGGVLGFERGGANGRRATSDGRADTWRSHPGC